MQTVSENGQGLHNALLGVGANTVGHLPLEGGFSLRLPQPAAVRQIHKLDAVDAEIVVIGVRPDAHQRLQRYRWGLRLGVEGRGRP